LSTDAEEGLTDQVVAERQRTYGRNELEEPSPPSLWNRVVDHFNSLVVWILIAAAVISAVIGDLLDTFAILAIVILNVAISVFQEERAGRALAALRKLASPTVRVVRTGMLRSEPIAAIVPGDVVEIEAGDNLPADVRLLTTFGFRTQEATLTGESAPVDKCASNVLEDEAPLGSRSNMAFMGTVAIAGRARAVVVATGMTTELGRIAGLLQAQPPEPTPLEKRLADLGKVLVAVCLAIVSVVFFLNLYRGGELLQVALMSVSLAVAAVPEGLPAVVTLTLAVGLQRMVKRHALIRRLPSVETLGAVTVICSDKTGTLTRNEMNVRELYAGQIRYRVSGTGYEPRGQFDVSEPCEQGEGYIDSQPDGQPIAHVTDQSDLKRALEVASICNDAALQAPTAEHDSWSVTGDPTEGALLVAAAKYGIDATSYRGERVHEIPFDSDRKAMSVVLQKERSLLVMYTKGAPEVVLAKCSAELRGGRVCPISEARRQEIRTIGSEMASRALRVLAFAFREHRGDDLTQFCEDELVFAGLAGIIDSPRDEAIVAVHHCRKAGIRPIMITGDHPDTALAVARATGIATPGDRIISGRELDELSDSDLSRDIANFAVYARVSAEHKLRIVRAWQMRGDVVAMTGDGVNDAPAVKAADIGIAMGVTGSDVTKETADMVLTDDNFASIVSAVEEGRGIFDNIQKFVHFLLSCNAAEVLLMLAAGMAGWPPPLTALQILWINLITDGFPALALGMEPTERDVMQRAPRRRNESVITWPRGLKILRHGLLMAFTAATAFWWIYRGRPEYLLVAQSATFCIVAYMQLFYSLSCRCLNDTAPEIGFLTNPHLLAAVVVSAVIQLALIAIPATRAVFQVSPEVLGVMPTIVLASLTPVTLVEATKLARRWIGRGQRKVASSSSSQDPAETVG